MSLKSLSILSGKTEKSPLSIELPSSSQPIGESSDSDNSPKEKIHSLHEKVMLAAPFKYPDKYSINLMWINRTLDKSKPYICGYGSEEDLLEKFLDKAKKWKETNPEAEIIIWYDSQFTTPEQLAATKAVLDKNAKENPFYNIKLRDIRDIDIVRNNPDAFSDNIPVYFRVDLMKLIICVNSIETDSNEAAIFADLEVGDYRVTKDRMSKKDLFNPEVMKNLEAIGIQFALHDSWRIENQFIQVLNKPITLNAIKVYINACFSRAITALNLGRNITDLSTSVFAMQEDQLIPLIEMGAYDKEVLVNIGLLKTGVGEEWIKYKIDEHGYLPLGNYYLRNYKKAYFLKENEIGDSLSYLKILKLHTDSFAGDFGISFARPVDVRPGNDHVEDISRLVKRTPADGSKIYKFRPWGINKKDIHVMPPVVGSEATIKVQLLETPVSLVAEEPKQKIKEKNPVSSHSTVSISPREFTPQRNQQRRKRQSGISSLLQYNVAVPLRWSKRIAAKRKDSSESFVVKRGCCRVV